MEDLRIVHHSRSKETYRHIAEDFYTKEIVIVDNDFPLSIGGYLSGDANDQPGFWKILEQKGRIK